MLLNRLDHHEQQQAIKAHLKRLDQISRWRTRALRMKLAASLVTKDSLSSHLNQVCPLVWWRGFLRDHKLPLLPLPHKMIVVDYFEDLVHAGRVTTEDAWLSSTLCVWNQVDGSSQRHFVLCIPVLGSPRWYAWLNAKSLIEQGEALPARMWNAILPPDKVKLLPGDMTGSCFDAYYKQRRKSLTKLTKIVWEEIKEFPRHHDLW